MNTTLTLDALAYEIPGSAITSYAHTARALKLYGAMSLVESIQLYEHSQVEAVIASGVLGLKHSISAKEHMSSSTFTLRTCTETMHCTTKTWNAVHALLYWSVIDAQRDSAP